MTVELVAEKMGVPFNKKGFKGIYGEKIINGEKTLFLKPQTFMNLSGESVAETVSFFKIPPEKVLVVYDDLDIPIGSLRIRPSGSAGTHNGMRNIVERLGSQNFPRVRIGTKPEGEYNIIDYVLSDVKKEDEPRFKISVGKAALAVEEFIGGSKIDQIMQKYNG